MSAADRKERFGNGYLINVTDEERKYFGLSPISPDWDIMHFYHKNNPRVRLTAFFSGDTIVKVINEFRTFPETDSTGFESYTEYDTALETRDRSLLLPLTSRGKPKPLSVAGIDAITPFGCRLFVSWEKKADTRLYLSNPRANKEFPVGEWERTSTIHSDADFHGFMKHYIATCGADYFDKLRAFTSAQKVTVKYRPGNLFRMELDRTRYCYGLITGEVRKLKAMPDLPEKHSLRNLMLVPILVRFYRLITDNPNLKADDLYSVPLGRLHIVGDNDIIWGNHTIIDHKQLTPEDLEFHFVCRKIKLSSKASLATQNDLLRSGSEQEYALHIEWGFAQTNLPYAQLSPQLKEMLAQYTSPHSGISASIDPRIAVPDEKIRQRASYQDNLLNPENRRILEEIFACLGLESDTTFDQFAHRFGGLTRQEITERMEHI